MAVSINMPQRQEQRQGDDDLTKVLKAVQIARNIMGTKQEYDKSQQDQTIANQQKTTFEQTQADRTAGMDPNSPQSIAARRLADQMAGPGAAEGMNQADVARNSDLLKQIGAHKNSLETAKIRGSSDDHFLANQIKQLQLAELQKKQTELDAPRVQAATFGRRMEQADAVIKQLAEQGHDRTSLANAANAMLPGGLQSQGTKQQEQAERNFVNAILRRESGAMISKDEFANAELQYFPRAGDGPDALAQKEQNRAQAMLGLKNESGRAWDQVPLLDTPKSKTASNGPNKVNGAPLYNGNEAQAAAPAQAHPQANEALTWAKQNPKDPRAAVILKRVGQ